MGKYFGTDGIRGVYGEGVSDEIAYRVGRSLASAFGGRCLVARDTRVSSKALEIALVRGLNAGGADAYLAGILPTPAVSFLVAKMGFESGVMITASHNSAEFNGLKVFGKGGCKLTTAAEDLVEFGMKSTGSATGGGRTLAFASARGLYIRRLVEGRGRLDGLDVVLDCGYGACGGIADEVFTRLGAKPRLLNSEPKGEKINDGCGALFIEKLAGTEHGLAFGFDGDGDRVAAALDGSALCGDSFLYNLSKVRPLKDGVVVGTVMSNIALEKRLESEGRRLVRTAVGDKYITEKLVGGGYNLGGEQSGHYIFFPESTSGDGLLSALVLSEVFAKEGSIERLKLVPQKTVSLTLDKSLSADERLTKFADSAGRDLARTLIRFSGTEPKIRMMAEDEDSEKVDRYLSEFTDLVKQLQNQKTT